MELEKKQELEWIEAQKIEVSVDLAAAAKQQLNFLKVVDRNRWLYDGPALQRAIYRYKGFWLPLLAKHSKSGISEGLLVVPLDCEWIWHCHRLNPVRYKTDCEKFYGRILDNSNVVSSIQGICKRQTEEIWNRLFPDEPYDFDPTRALSEDVADNLPELENCTDYDLVSAVKRQSPFFYQVSRSHMNNDLFIEGAVARYKGFLHLIKRNKENSVKQFCVPTYDIDLIWHTHQLHPVSYCKDLNKALGKVLEHDDTDSDRTKGKKLDVGFSGTTKQWEETFGTRYWRAGAMYRGNNPSPLPVIPFSSKSLSKKFGDTNELQKIIHFSQVKVIEVLLEIVGVKNLPDNQKGSLFVLFSKSQPDLFFDAKQRLTILSESAEKQVASFQCEPTGELLFELVSQSASSLPITKSYMTLGTASLCLREFLVPVSTLSVEKWLDLTPNGNQISLRVAASFTVPISAPVVAHIVRSRPFSKSSCFFSIPGRDQHSKSWTRVIDECEAEVISLKLRETKANMKGNCTPRKQVIGLTKSGDTHILAEFVGTHWSLMDSQWCLQPEEKAHQNGSLFELMGDRMIKFFPGRRLEYEPKCCKKNEGEFITGVEFSVNHPYGKAVALLDLKSGFLKANEEWMVLPGIISAFILMDTLKKKGHPGFNINGANVKKTEGITEKVIDEKDLKTDLPNSVETQMKSNVDLATRNAVPPKGGSCSGGCGAGCGSEKENVLKSGGCGGCGSGGCGGCGSGCGNMVKAGACGGCGGSCGNMVKAGACGGCGGSCGNTEKASGCGGRCGGGCGGACGNMGKASGCGACGGECGNMPKNGGSVGAIAA